MDIIQQLDKEQVALSAGKEILTSSPATPGQSKVVEGDKCPARKPTKCSQWLLGPRHQRELHGSGILDGEGVERVFPV